MAQYQVTAHPIKSTAQRTLPREIQPGIGFDGLFLGQSEGEVLDLWGEPEGREQIDDSFYFIYKKLALEVEFHNHSVYRLFLFVRRGANRELASVGGVGIGATRQRVVRRLGQPAQRAAGRSLSSGKYLRGWFLYPDGVQFDFGKNGKVEVITIFGPSDDVYG